MASEVRSRSWESDLGGQGRAGPSPSPTSEPSRPEEQDPHRAGALRVAQSPRAAREHRPFGRQGRRGAPRERTGERGVSPSRRQGLRPPDPQAVVRELPKRLTIAHGGPGPAPRSPAPGSRCPLPARRTQVPPSDRSGPLPTEVSLPSPIASLRPGKVWLQLTGLESRTHPRREEPKRPTRGSRGRRRAAARTRSSSQRPLLPLPPTEL